MKFPNRTTASGIPLRRATAALCIGAALLAWGVAPVAAASSISASPSVTTANPPASGEPGAGSGQEAGLPLTPGGTTDDRSGQPTGTTERSIVARIRPVRARISPRKVRFGSRVAVSGRSGLGGRSRIKLLFRRNGSSAWSRLKTVTSDRRGRYRTRIKAKASGRVRVEVKGNPDSAVKPLTVRSVLRVGSVRRYVNLGDRLRITGTVLPRGVRKLTIPVSGSGHRVLRTRTNAHGKFRLKWSPGRSGNYRLRVSAASNRVARGDRSRTIRVVGLRPTHASYYGPGLYGGALACGGSLSPGTRGVAHKTLPCGSKVTLRYGKRTVTTRVVDRGPYVAGREFDLTAATRNDLGFGDTGTVWTNR